MTQIVVALIGLAGTIIAALIASRNRPAVTESAQQAAHRMGLAPPPPPQPLSRSVWIGGVALVLWLIPLLAYIALPFGFYAAVRDKHTKRGTVAGIAMCSVALLLAVLNSILGAYQGAHGMGWWQR